MAAVNQRVLNWLYSVLTGQYQDVDRTYNDTAQALSHYSSLSPKTEVYTYENGTSALLLQLSGTLPVSFRGAAYRFPVTIWVPQQYPRVEPIIYVTPSDGLVVRAGQHVDPQGRVYHPYLARWADHSDKSNIVDFLAILRDVFAKEPPVVSRQPQQQPISSPRPQSIPPPLPPLPSDMVRPSPAPSSPSGGPRPPPPPPKPQGVQLPQANPQPPTRTNTGPPLPPLPPSPVASRSGQAPPYQSPQHFGALHNQHAPARQSSLRYESAPSLPAHPQHQQPPLLSQQVHRSPPPLPNNQYAGPSQQYGSSQSSHQRIGSYGQPLPPQQTYPDQGQPPPWQQQPPPEMGYPTQQYQQATPEEQPKQKAPIPDLLDDSPALTPPCSNLPVPPVPRNPEKDMMLHQIAQKLYDIRQAEAAKHSTTLRSLSAQRDALNNALHKLQAESSQLSSLQGTLNSNTTALNESLARADQLMKKVPALTPPSIDDLLVAPTVVANQLYDLVAEEKALGDAIFSLGRAVEKGRVEPQVFVKMVRGLSRELFGKKMLIRKCSKGMGLDDGRESGY